MGVYLNVEMLDGHAHPEWEFGKFSGDIEAANAILDECGMIQYPPAEQFDPWLDSTLRFRPANLSALDSVTWPDVNADRWVQLVRILREQPDYWLRFD